MLYMVDGYAGTPHITAPQVGDYNAGITGVGSCVFNVGEKLRAESVNANTVRIYDGSFLFQGYRRGGIQTGSYEDVTIENGTQDQKRNDIIAVRYEKDSASQTESFSLAVLKGTPGADGEDPSYTAGDIREGDLVCYMPLYRVRLEGINLTGLEPLFAVRKTMAELEAEVGELKDDLANTPKSYSNPSQLGLTNSTCTLVDLHTALPVLGTIMFWVTSSAYAAIQAEINEEIGRTFGLLSATKATTGITTYTFYGYVGNSITPEEVYIATYDTLNGGTHWHGFIKMVTETKLEDSLSGVRIAAGTKIVSTSGNTSAALFTRAQINSMFGTSYPANGADYIGSHIGIFASNGDSNANDAHIDCVTYNPDTGTFLATFDRTVNSNVRVNYLVVCF